MKIIFLCGCLEPGRDGVGDYVRRLAGEMIRHGHKVAATAFKDPYCDNLFVGDQEAGRIKVPVLRIPSAWSGRNRFKIARDWINNFNPEWLSIQFVPFSFHSKGLPFGLGNRLADIGKGRQVHVMFHELWIGMDTKSTTKSIIIGRIQKLIIFSLVKKVKPIMMHTQTRLYQDLLLSSGVRADYLPLFSNIPVFNKTKPGVASKHHHIQLAGIISLVLFGAIHPHAPVEQLAREAAEYSRRYAVRINVKILGRCGAEQYRWEKAWATEAGTVDLLGELSEESISEILSNASLGVTTYRHALVEKSGTVTAMLAHGLQVLCISEPWEVKGIGSINPPDGVLNYEPGNFEGCLNANYTTPVSFTVTQVYRKFIESLEGIRSNFNLLVR